MFLNAIIFDLVVFYVVSVECREQKRISSITHNPLTFFTSSPFFKSCLKGQIVMNSVILCLYSANWTERVTNVISYLPFKMCNIWLYSTFVEVFYVISYKVFFTFTELFLLIFCWLWAWECKFFSEFSFILSFVVNLIIFIIPYFEVG